MFLLTWEVWLLSVGITTWCCVGGPSGKTCGHHWLSLWRRSLHGGLVALSAAMQKKAWCDLESSWWHWWSSGSTKSTMLLKGWGCKPVFKDKISVIPHSYFLWMVYKPYGCWGNDPCSTDLGRKESQDQRVVGVAKDLQRSSGPSPLSKQNHLW